MIGTTISVILYQVRDAYSIYPGVAGMLETVLDLGQMRPCASSVMRPLTWALKEVDPVGLHRQSGIHAQEI